MDLFPYQETGARQLAGSRAHYLGDEPGLGKSAQVVTACDYARARRILIVCPASLKVNWAREFDKFSGTGRPVSIVSTGKDRLPTGPWGVTIVNYDLVINKHIHNQIRNIDWDVMDFDEGHALKNPFATRTRASLGEIGIVDSAEQVWLNSGTPVPNHPGELYPVLAKLHPKATRGMDYDTFLNYYCHTIPTTHGHKVIGNKPTISQLKADIASFMLRRKREEVLPDLPELRMGTLTVSNEKALRAIKEAEACLSLAAMVGDEDATDDMIDWVNDREISTLRKMCGAAKALALVEEIADELDGGLEQIVLMCWHHDTMDILSAGLEKYGVAKISGKTPNAQRQKEVDRFTAHSDTTNCRVFIGQILAAGEGITLTTANQMIIVEPSWVPKDNLQAMLRIMRIGQNNPCLVRFAALAGSIDEAIMAVAQRKANMIAELL